ncbi:MAG TPA: hypothetical protein VMF69_18715 [Gemmataceae bacterium]|nr:hypothetical protein [Gemmataceae bacterium]
MISEPFLKPRLIGKRFEGGVIPLELLADFAVLEEMIVEVAKGKFREANPGRKRVPRGFTDGITLKLAGIEDGSAIPIIELVFAASTLFPPSAQTYFEDARNAIIGAIGAAEQGTSITPFLEQRLLGYFDRFGRNLSDGEAIEFDNGLASPATVRLTKEVRRKLVLASEADEVTDTVALHGVIPEMDQQAKTFHIRLVDGAKVKAPLNAQHFDTVMEAFTNYQENQWVRMIAIGRFNRANRLQGIESVEHISILDPLDIAARIDEFKLLKAGWLDGKGVAPDHDGLDWLSEAFDRRYPDDLSLPYLFPTPEGCVLAEWSLHPWSPSLEIDLAKKRGDWHVLNLDTDEEETKELDLTNDGDWKWLTQQIRNLGGEAE